MILGNKSDSYNKVIDYDDGFNFAQKYKMPFYEVSAKLGSNIQHSFNTLIQELTDQKAQEVKKAEFQVIELDDDPLLDKKPSFLCCTCPTLW